MSGRVVSWFSCGAASAVATKLSNPDVIAYCDTGSEDSDNRRFMADCEVWFGKPITIIKNEEYADTWDVWERRRFIAGNAGAPCTGYLKVEARLAFQRPDDIHIFGYTNDAADILRAKNLRKNFFELTIETPLIDQGIDKAACLALVQRAGIALPRTYALGFPNANCMPCGKATSPNYWALVRLTRPVEFLRFAALSRKLGVRAARINDERIFVDEIPADWPVTQPIVPACDLLCGLVADDLSNPGDQS